MFENWIKQIAGFKAYNMAIGEMLLLTVNNALADVALATTKKLGGTVKLPVWATGAITTFGVPKLFELANILGTEGGSRLTVAIGSKALDEIFKIEDTIEATVNKLIGTLIPQLSGAEEEEEIEYLPESGQEGEISGDNEEISGAQEYLIPDAESAILAAMTA